MRNYNGSLTLLDSQLSKLVPDQESCQFGSSKSSIDPTVFMDKNFSFNFRNLDYQQRIMMAISSWYLEDLGHLIRADLRDSLRIYSFEDRTLLEILLESKSIALNWLLESTFWSARDFFGNQVTKIDKIFSLIRIKKPSKKKVKPYTGYTRGYGTSSHSGTDKSWLRARNFEEDCRIQQEREAQKVAQRDTTQFLIGFLMG